MVSVLATRVGPAVVLPAEKTHYRKGLTLGLTLAETFSVVVFVLLLVCWILLGRAEDQREMAEDSLADVKTDLAIAEELLHGGDTSWISTERWYRYAQELEARLDSTVAELTAAVAREQEAQALLDSAEAEPSSLVERLGERSAELALVRDSLQRVDSLLQVREAERDTHAEAASEGERLREIVADAVAARHDDLTSSQVDSVVAQAARAGQLAERLEDVSDVVRSQTARLRDRERLFSSGSVVDTLLRETARLRTRSDSLERELQQGTEPFPCWSVGNLNEVPEHIFRVELTDGGMVLYPVVPQHRLDDEVMPDVRRIEVGREYPPADFLRLTEPIHQSGVRRQSFGERGCRFWVRPVPRTESAAVLVERQQQLGRHFYYRW